MKLRNNKQYIKDEVQIKIKKLPREIWEYILAIKIFDHNRHKYHKYLMDEVHFCEFGQDPFISPFKFCNAIALFTKFDDSKERRVYMCKAHRDYLWPF
jgi:hypothetical protein